MPLRTAASFAGDIFDRILAYAVVTFYDVGMTTDPTVEQTRKLIAESRALLEGLRDMRAETRDAPSRKVIDESLQSLSQAQAKLANLPQSDTSGR
jgi:hypothetical protein